MGYMEIYLSNSLYSNYVVFQIKNLISIWELYK